MKKSTGAVKKSAAVKKSTGAKKPTTGVGKDISATKKVVKKVAVRISRAVISKSKPQIEKAKTLTSSPGTFKTHPNNNGENMGYFAAGSIVMILGLLLVSQNELKDDITQGQESVAQVQVESLPGPSSPLPKSEPVAQRAASGVLTEEFKLALSLNSSERIKFWSSYIESSREHQEKVAELANGLSVEDVAPIIPKSYDCTTFVETVAALTRSNSQDQFIAHLMAIRYKDGAANFYARNHLPESDWIPNNERAGILKDITQEVAQAHGLAPRFAEKKIDRNKWLAARAKEEGVARNLASTNEEASEVPVQIQVPYISIAQLKGVIGGIPDGTVINLVHAPSRKHTGVITHQGFLIREGSQYFLRHASRNGTIRSSELFTYLAMMRKQRSWPVVGVNLNQFSDSSPAISSATQVLPPNV